ncbi:MAG TPA: DUF3464 domain-containing protein [Cyanobacteria bacterium UBA8156]|jgi:hypothetical protein|nr:DUF3464 domain-containing protein [Cyanobacteria bacterium UBA8156]
MSEPKPLPFEPKGRNARQKAQKTAPTTANTERKGRLQAGLQEGRKAKPKTGRKPESKPNPAPTDRAAAQGIPQEVSDRMVRRAAVFCGIPTAMGFGSLVLSYIVISRHWLEVSNTLVLLVSLGLTGLGVLGLSYGALSASWDPGRVGSLWGSEEFRKNLGYLVTAWRSQRAVSSSPVSPAGEDSPPNTP